MNGRAACIYQEIDKETSSIIKWIFKKGQAGESEKNSRASKTKSNQFSSTENCYP